jgi:hypothetical protein
LRAAAIPYDPTRIAAIGVKGPANITREKTSAGYAYQRTNAAGGVVLIARHGSNSVTVSQQTDGENVLDDSDILIVETNMSTIISDQTRQRKMTMDSTDGGDTAAAVAATFNNSGNGNGSGKARTAASGSSYRHSHSNGSNKPQQQQQGERIAGQQHQSSSSGSGSNAGGKKGTNNINNNSSSSTKSTKTHTTTTTGSGSSSGSAEGRRDFGSGSASASGLGLGLGPGSQLEWDADAKAQVAQQQEEVWLQAEAWIEAEAEAEEEEWKKLATRTYDVPCYSFLPFLFVMSFFASLSWSITARLHSLTPHDTSLTIISSLNRSSINRHNTPSLVNTLQVLAAVGLPLRDRKEGT